MSETRHETESWERRLSGNSRELITAKEVEKLMDKICVNETEIIDYTIRMYSEEKIGFLGSHQHLAIRAKDKKDENCNPMKTFNFFIKAMPYEIPTQAEYVKEKGVFDQETYFFDKVMPELLLDYKSEPWAPECYLIKGDCLVFEELRTLGFKMSGKLLNEREIRAGLDAIARYHGASLRAEKRLGVSLNEIFPDAFKERAFLRCGNQYRWYLAGVDVAVKIGETMNLDVENVPAACSRVFEAIKPSRAKQNVASHGDLWSNNLMFDESNPPRCRLVDFQLARYSPLGHDVAQFLYLCASRNFRDEHTREMLRHYYRCLVNNLEESSTIEMPAPSWRDFLDSYEEQKLGALVTAVMYFPTVLLDGMIGAKILNDSDTYEKFVMIDRREIVVENMNGDAEYRRRLEETVMELAEVSTKLDQLPTPC